MTSLNQRIKILEVYSGIETSVISISDVSELQTELDTKQDTLTAGDNITIVDNVISSSGSGGSGASLISDVSGLQDELDALSLTDTTLQTSIDSKQDILTAGDNITIVDNTISSSGGSSSSAFVGFRAVALLKGGITTPIGNISYLLDDTSTAPYSYDTNNLYDTTTGTFLPDRNGYWQMGFKFYNNAGENTQYQTNQIKLRRDGVELGPIVIAGNHNGQAEDVTTTAYLLVGDEIYINHEGNTSLYIFNASNNFFEARFVGV